MNDNSVPVIRNSILSALPPAISPTFEALLEYVKLPRGSVLYRPGAEVSHVYFPNRSVISVVAYSEDGRGAEVAVIGYEGATGLDIILGSDTTLNEHITQVSDGAFRMKTADVRKQFAECGPFHDLLLEFTQKFMVQISQTALCNRLHNTGQRLSRWLLMCQDRTDSGVFNLTQEFLSIMLGANRTTVTMTAIELQNRGLISYSRGSLTITDRAGLEEFACPCYATIRTAYGLMP